MSVEGRVEVVMMWQEGSMQSVVMKKEGRWVLYRMTTMLLELVGLHLGERQQVVWSHEEMAWHRQGKGDVVLSSASLATPSS
ncbi:uncharacterized protein MONOS_4612 [Monocercomonoides exilis]|uniref:uncharacterized protein n=1 Tax=Monocercomonoides exilis TaxID=2049356 RepID=UPI00355AA529|nr:hypothetical protein MONOS_4612 [Monocercomonoides exilis]|eukprot:MONOS_4612.1-p1 / transcript=MONOS_4612.1 / gene=MONOS_4612 / organism=Monocercomonoides_exilis_PA203 / gene_product=unspecified product / transcript_product=unspecified product / location=Mono_scaffold00124:97742-97987(+) / protein_length=82 / sequence_SO=supercontig / SO=protein_coding / is_pseudo=false